MQVSTVFFCAFGGVAGKGAGILGITECASQKAHLHPQPEEHVDANQLARSAALSLAPNRQGILAYKRLLFISRSPRVVPPLSRQSPFMNAAG